MKKIKTVYYLFINLVLYCFALLIPKNKSLWVFGSWFGQKYSDNPKAFFEYINKHQSTIAAVWITKDKTIVDEVQSRGGVVYLERSMAGIWHQLRANYAFVCQSLQDDVFAPCIGKKTTVVNLWHGLPLKKIMYDVFGDKVKTKNKWGQFVDAISPYDKIRNDYLLATSIETQKILSQAFRIPKSRTLITGFPRNDIFLNHSIITEDKPFQCIYMPTFRGGMGTECDLFSQYGFNVQEIDATLKTNNIELILRMHPVNKPPVYLIEKIKNSKMLKMDLTPDIYESITSYDCLITDYSSIYFDFLLTNRPIVFSAFDLERYKQNERELYFEFEDVTLKPNCLNWNEVIERVVDLKKSGISMPYKKSYQELKEKFHGKELDSNESFSRKLFNKLCSSE